MRRVSEHFGNEYKEGENTVGQGMRRRHRQREKEIARERERERGRKTDCTQAETRSLCWKPEEKSLLLANRRQADKLVMHGSFL